MKLIKNCCEKSLENFLNFVMKMEVLTVQNQFQSHQFGVIKHPKVEGEFRGYNSSSSRAYSFSSAFITIVKIHQSFSF